MNVSNVDSLPLQQPLARQQLQSVSEFSYSSGPGSLGEVSSDTGDAEDDPAFKRAEQNRAAQRAFRQRKQQYIKWLEGKAEELDEVYRIMSMVRTENQQLRKLVMELDACLNGPPKGMAMPTPKIDLSLSREVALRLTNLVTLSGAGAGGDRSVVAVGRPKYQPRSSSIAKGGRGKGKGAYKLNQLKEQQRQQTLMVQNQQAIQIQEQYRQREFQRHQQRSTAMPITTGTDGGGNAVTLTNSLAPTPVGDFLSMSSASQLPLQFTGTVFLVDAR